MCTRLVPPCLTEIVPAPVSPCLTHGSMCPCRPDVVITPPPSKPTTQSLRTTVCTSTFKDPALVAFTPSHACAKDRSPKCRPAGAGRRSQRARHCSSWRCRTTLGWTTHGWRSWLRGAETLRRLMSRDALTFRIRASNKSSSSASPFACSGSRECARDEGGAARLAGSRGAVPSYSSSCYRSSTATPKPSAPPFVHLSPRLGLRIAGQESTCPLMMRSPP